jgi:uncharacterized integral membrane protein
MTQIPTSFDPELSPVYQGHYGSFTITKEDRTGVIIYRTGLMVAALCLAIGTILILLDSNYPLIGEILTGLYVGFSLALGVSLAVIHIYMVILHRFLQLSWLLGVIASISIAFTNTEPLVIAVYNHPIFLYGIGFTFVALTGIYFKEAFCFNRLETKILTPLVPLLLLGHLWGFLSSFQEQVLLGAWALLFCVFALRKTIQEIPDDIGDKSVFDHLQSHH